MIIIKAFLSAINSAFNLIETYMKTWCRNNMFIKCEIRVQHHTKVPYSSNGFQFLPQKRQAKVIFLGSHIIDIIVYIDLPVSSMSSAKRIININVS